MESIILSDVQGLDIRYHKESYGNANRRVVEIRHGNGEMVKLYGPHIKTLHTALSLIVANIEGEEANG